MKKAVVLVSGGLDSCVTAACAVNDGLEPAFLHLSYGQLTEKRELRAFNEIAAYYCAKESLVVNMSHLSDIGGSCLTDTNIAVPNAELKNTDIPTSYVPFRNANLLAAAVSWAEVISADRICWCC